VTKDIARVHILLVGALCLSCVSTPPVTAPQNTTNKTAQAVPPSQGEPFYEFAELPAGPKVIAGAFTGTEVDDKRSSGSSGPSDVSNAITRREIVNFVALGPRHALTLVQVQPAFQGQHFVGYQVTGLSQEGEQVFGSALRRGDVILKVNERSIARPEDYMTVWQSLEASDRVSITLLRAGAQIAMSWPVVE
jgi:hypothetical protein